jgi:hypothetical protein
MPGLGCAVKTAALRAQGEAPVLLVFWGCDVCGDAREDGYYTPCDDGLRRCVRCWKKAGRPFRRLSDPAAAHDAAVATRKRMTQRGGADRHLVRSGRT